MLSFQRNDIEDIIPKMRYVANIIQQCDSLLDSSMYTIMLFLALKFGPSKKTKEHAQYVLRHTKTLKKSLTLVAHPN